VVISWYFTGFVGVPGGHYRPSLAHGF